MGAEIKIGYKDRIDYMDWIERIAGVAEIHKCPDTRLNEESEEEEFWSGLRLLLCLTQVPFLAPDLYSSHSACASSDEPKKSPTQSSSYREEHCVVNAINAA